MIQESFSDVIPALSTMVPPESLIVITFAPKLSSFSTVYCATFDPHARWIAFGGSDGKLEVLEWAREGREAYGGDKRYARIAPVYEGE